MTKKPVNEIMKTAADHKRTAKQADNSKKGKPTPSAGKPIKAEVGRHD